MVLVAVVVVVVVVVAVELDGWIYMATIFGGLLCVLFAGEEPGARRRQCLITLLGSRAHGDYRRGRLSGGGGGGGGGGGRRRRRRGAGCSGAQHAVAEHMQQHTESKYQHGIA